MTTFLILLAVVLAIALVITGVQSKQNAEKARRCCDSSRQMEQDKLVLVSQVNKLKAQKGDLECIQKSYRKDADAAIEQMKKAKQELQDLQVAYEKVAKDYNVLKAKEEARKAQWAAARAKKKQKNQEESQEQTSK